jgi:hypothetical protein
MARVNDCAHAGCGVRLILAKGPLGRRFPPLNAFEDPLGTAAAQHLASGAWSARFLASGEEPVVPEKRYSVHECEEADDPALRVPCPECKRPAGSRCITLDTHQPSNLVHRGRAHAAQRAQVKAALADQARAARNRRGHRPGPQVTGYVIQPPQLPGMGDR